METAPEIRYAGVALAWASDVRELPLDRCFLAVAEPLPVGTAIELRCGDSSVAARVERVVESTTPGISGMEIRFEEAGAVELLGLVGLDRSVEKPAPPVDRPAPAEPAPAAAHAPIDEPPPVTARPAIEDPPLVAAGGPVEPAYEPAAAQPASAEPSGGEHLPAMASSGPPPAVEQLSPEPLDSSVAVQAPVEHAAPISDQPAAPILPSDGDGGRGRGRRGSRKRRR